jgi:hypothetical protein
MRYPRLCFFLLFVMLLASTGVRPAVAQAPSPSAGEPDSDEIAVMAVILDAAYAHAAQGWVLVGARTATFECNPPANIGMDIGGCSGMRDATESPEERLATVRVEIPDVSTEIAADLLRKSRGSVVLSRVIPVPIQQVVWAPGIAVDFKFSGNPTFAAYFSRVGFDSGRAKALIYLGTMNWTDRSKSLGQYLYLEKQMGAWVIKTHVKVWD